VNDLLNGEANAIISPCSPEDRMALAGSLGDCPETVAAIHLLTRNRCRAYVAGSVRDHSAVIIQALTLPGEPIGYGHDATALWDLLSGVSYWYCLNVSDDVARPLGALMERDTGHPITYFDDILYVLDSPVTSRRCPQSVRLLTLDDLPRLAAAPAEVRGIGFGDPGALLEQGIVAAAIVDGNIVSIAHTSALSPRHAEISVSTIEAWRNRGLASAAASLVIRKIQDGGRTPVWVTGEDNLACQRVAQKLGFLEVGRRTYVILR
jgi:hypothetical protein